jgi:Flp pilus assembly pilin Flp
MLEFATQWVKDNIKREEGQAMAEYGIILAVVAVFVVAALILFRNGIANTLDSVVNAL